MTGSETTLMDRPSGPLWETQLGASFVGTAGNTEATTMGTDFLAARRWESWEIESTASALRTRPDQVGTAER